MFIHHHHRASSGFGGVSSLSKCTVNSFDFPSESKGKLGRTAVTRGGSEIDVVLFEILGSEYDILLQNKHRKNFNMNESTNNIMNPPKTANAKPAREFELSSTSRDLLSKASEQKMVKSIKVPEHIKIPLQS